MATGIDIRHRSDGKPAYQAHVFDKRTGRRIRKTFDNKTAAKQWRTDAMAALRNGTLTEAKPKTTIREACDAWIRDARAAIVRTRGGDPFQTRHHPRL